MNRRDAVKSLGLVSGHVLFPSVLASFLHSCAHKDMSSYSPVFFSSKEYKLITEMIDIIIPATKTASASQVNTQVFLDQVFSQCMTKEQQQVIHEGLAQISSTFAEAKDKTLFIADADKKAFNKDKSYSWFKTVKKFTMIGFFTSQEGTTKASNYVKVPDGYKGEIPLDSNTLNYGKTSLHY
ncbi:MAG: gluconate 2-dehydrogenase subunit 3 family protein [Chitinophagaceae bacterium]|nr:gluconate 2-dehydrogenase subunit 3 family protein [Chitinophagaceae bacterium]